MAKTASDFLVERLYEWGVRRVYGYPGDGINGVMGALNRAREKIEFVQTRHEEHGFLHGLRATRNSPAKSASASPRRARAPFTCSTDFTTLSSTTSRSGDRRAAGPHLRSGPITSRKSTSFPSSRTSPAISSIWRAPRPRSVNLSTAPSASQSRSAP